MAARASKGSGPGPDGGRRGQALADYQRTMARQKRRSRLIIATSVLAAVVIVAAAVVAIGLNRDSGPSAPTTAASGDVIAGVSGVPAATFDSVGAGTASGFPKAIDAPSLTAGGKPRVLYVGAEYCPYCAAERWSVVAAMSRFGTFTDLGQTASAHDDVDPDTNTLSFHGASYTSDYLAFTGVETQSNQRQGNSYAPLDTLTADDQKTFGTYDFPPYTQSQGSIPFVDLGGKYIISGASYDPGLLAGMTHEQIAAAMSDPTSPVGQAIDGSANVITASLCQLTGGQPGAVCTSAGVTAAAAKLG